MAVLLDAESRADDAELLVAVNDGDDIIGTVTVCRPGNDLADIARPGEIEVRMLAVADHFAHQGVGSLLMEHVHERARNEHFEAVVLSVIATNTAAIRFYRRLGYRPEPERDWLPRADMDAMLEVFIRPTG